MTSLKLKWKPQTYSTYFISTKWNPLQSLPWPSSQVSKETPTQALGWRTSLAIHISAFLSFCLLSPEFILDALGQAHEFMNRHKRLTVIIRMYFPPNSRSLNVTNLSQVCSAEHLICSGSLGMQSSIKGSMLSVHAWILWNLNIFRAIYIPLYPCDLLGWQGKSFPQPRDVENTDFIYTVPFPLAFKKKKERRGKNKDQARNST